MARARLGHGPAGGAATGVMIGCLDVLRPEGKALVIAEESGQLAAALEARGVSVVSWDLAASDGRTVSPKPWPGPQAADAVFIRLPKVKELLDLMLHAAASRLQPRAQMIVFGGNDEGIRSSERHLGLVASNVLTIETKGHCRVLSGQRLETIDALKSDLGAWRRVGNIEIAGQSRSWVSYPGAFAKGGLDAGTRLLVESLEDLKAGLRILDFAAGTGVVAAWILARFAGTSVDMVEADALAVEAARENVPGGRIIAGASLKAAAGQTYDLILSNPPVHFGVHESRGVLDQLIRDARGVLAPGGELRLVVQRRIAVMEALEGTFGNGRVVADDGRFTVVSAIKTRPQRHGR